ncbi:MAG TPA: molecular chaperone HtpG [Polyangiaceae bacterium]|nr:molecular chaperone HtpG [Polyangiaceae bacterium]
MSEAAKTHAFQAEVNQLLRLVIDSLYSNKEIFLRELISNASDALDKLRFEALTRPELLEGEARPEIRLSYDRAAGTLTVEDNGIGMGEDELAKNLGTIAHSGTRAFLEAAKQKGSAGGVDLIGQFGVGFYSAFLVADRVEVTSRPAGPGSAAHRWSSDARGSFTIEPAERAGRGTSVVLHLKPDAREFLDDWRLRSLVTRYSDYVSAPILLKADEDEAKGDKAEGGEPKGGFQQINRASALWQRSPSEVKPEQYDEFYRHLTHDFEPPLAHAHFRIEGTQLFSGIIYLPKRLPLDFMREQQPSGLRLFVKRVFIMDDAAELLPPWLRFVRGVVDSDDLPLNVSREILQDSSVARVIKKQIVKKSLDLLDDLAQNRPDDYKAFWAEFGAILKEGIALEAGERERIADLARFASTKAEGLTSLSEYVTRMPLAQPAIYYAVGASASALAESPYLEALKRRGFEALLLSDPVDEWVVDALREYRGKPLTSAMRADLSLGGDEPPAEAAAARAPLFERIKKLLGDKVREVRASKRLTDSPVCLVLPPGALPPTMERVLRASGRPVPPAARILEVNPSHPLVEHMAALAEREPDSPKLGEWVELLYDQAVLLEGGTLDDPARFARRVNELLRDALAAATPAPAAPH